MDYTAQNPQIEQNYIVPWVVATFASLFGFILCVWLFWSVGIPGVLIGFGAFADDWPYLRDGLLLLTGGDGTRWHSYYFELQKARAVASLFVHLFAPLIMAMIAGMWLRRFLTQAFKPRDIHLRGPRYCAEPVEAAQALKKHADAEVVADGYGFRLHPSVVFSRERSNRGLITLAATGGGKTSILMPIFIEIHHTIGGQDPEQAFVHALPRRFRKRWKTTHKNFRVLAHDQKGDYTQQVPNDGFGLIAPWDKRSLVWAISRDIKTKADCRLLAESQILVDAHQPMWGNAARALFTGLMYYLCCTEESWGFADLVQLLSLKSKALGKIVEKAAPEAWQVIESAMSKDGATGQGVLINMKSFISIYYDLAQAWPGKGNFSIRDWLEDDYDGYRTIIVQNSYLHKALARGLINSLYTLAITKMVDTSFPEAKHRGQDYRVYFFFDEWDSMGKVDAIMDLITKGRSKGMYAFGGFQDINQPAKTYGDKDARTMISQIGTRIIGNIGGGDTADWIAKKLIGPCEIGRMHKSVSSDGMRNNESLSYHVHKTDVLLPSEFSADCYADSEQTLALVHSNGWNDIYRLRWIQPDPKPGVLRPAVIAADWTAPQKMDRIDLSVADEKDNRAPRNKKKDSDTTTPTPPPVAPAPQRRRLRMVRKTKTP